MVSVKKISRSFGSSASALLFSLIAFTSPVLAQAPPPSIIPTDVTPIGLGRQRELLRPGPTFYLLQKLPSRLWLNFSTEISQRGETNVFFTNRHHKGDYVFRALPSLTVGYKVLPRTSIYASYFTLKDVFAYHGNLTYPTTQSLAWGVRHEIPIRSRTNLQFDLQAREIWQARGLNQYDWLPGVTLTHVVNPSTIAFGNIQLQLRGAKYFVAPTREIDPFYTLGVLHRRGPWTFSLVDTFVSNFRNNQAIPPQTNMSMIVQAEVSRQVSKKIPGLVTFVRAEPVWNWQSRSVPGISGFDFRIFGGLRYTLNKTATNASMDNLRKQLKQSTSLPPKVGPQTINPPATSNSDPGVSPAPNQAADSAEEALGQTAKTDTPATPNKVAANSLETSPALAEVPIATPAAQGSVSPSGRIKFVADSTFNTSNQASSSENIEQTTDNSVKLQ
jgi:hypothetical protein